MAVSTRIHSEVLEAKHAKSHSVRRAKAGMRVGSLRGCVVLSLLAVGLSGCTAPDHLIKAQSIYDVDPADAVYLVDDRGTAAIRSMLPERNEDGLIVPQGGKSTIDVAIVSANNAIIASSPYVSDVKIGGNSVGAKVHDNYASISAGLAAAAFITAIFEGRQERQGAIDSLGLEEPSIPAFDLLRLTVSSSAYLRDHRIASGMIADRFVEATMLLRERPDPKLGELYAVAADVTLLACNHPWQSNSGYYNDVCPTAINIMEAVGLPSEIPEGFYDDYSSWKVFGW